MWVFSHSFTISELWTWSGGTLCWIFLRGFFARVLQYPKLMHYSKTAKSQKTFWKKAWFNNNDSTSIPILFNNDNNILLQNNNNHPSGKYSLKDIFSGPIGSFFVHPPVVPVFLCSGSGLTEGKCVFCISSRLAAWLLDRMASSPPLLCPASLERSKPLVGSFWRPATTLEGPMEILESNSIFPTEVSLLLFWGWSIVCSVG